MWFVLRTIRQHEAHGRRHSLRSLVFVSIWIAFVLLWSCSATWKRVLFLKEVHQHGAEMHKALLRSGYTSPLLESRFEVEKRLAMELSGVLGGDEKILQRFPMRVGCFWPNSSLVLQANETLKHRHEQQHNDDSNAGYFSSLFRPDKVFIKAIEKYTRDTKKRNEAGIDISIDGDQEMEEGCKVPCEYTWAQEELSEADGVLFFYHRIGKEKENIFSMLLPKSKKNKDIDQKFFLINLEAALQKRRIRFNRKLGEYGMDMLAYIARNYSDVHLSYLGAYELSELMAQTYLLPPITQRKHLGDKNNNSNSIEYESSALWLTSNCQKIQESHASQWSSYRRMELVRELMSLNLSISSYGRCLHNTDIPSDILARHQHKQSDSEEEESEQEQQSRTWALIKSDLLKRHKFVLSFENEDVPDYVTEKYYQPFAQGTLSIYFGAPNVEEEFELFPHSFIHLRHFSRLESAVEYIRMIAENDVLYDEYFAWKKFYKQVGGRSLTNAFQVAKDRSVWNSPCRICETLFVRLFKTRQLKKRLRAAATKSNHNR
eukprot:TRINITY_DN12502_c0_g1_i1.p1 TRINITY_DN12502_c0_g1~~TRINITY_DN12502_c0_g1_i1.p1  ORF type:complete len:545 (+),score=121.51 TRINITY_DN12502_c0_g1_i1:204-1838(+)